MRNDILQNCGVSVARWLLVKAGALLKCKTLSVRRRPLFYPQKWRKSLNLLVHRDPSPSRGPAGGKGGSPSEERALGARRPWRERRFFVKGRAAAPAEDSAEQAISCGRPVSKCPPADSTR